MDDNIKIAGAVILYYPHESVVDSINSYIHQLDYLYIVDNTDNADNSILISLIASGNYKYIPLQKNTGIATALNLAVRMAMSDGFNWVLTMDQDSFASHDMMSEMKKAISQYGKIGIIAPENGYNFRQSNGAYSEELLVMTSGSLLNASAYQDCGGFNDKLFIDHVDHEYCLRLKKNGYKIICCNNAKLKHQLGVDQGLDLFNYRRTVVHHHPLRFYYFVRNGIYVSFKYLNVYPFFSIIFLRQIFKELMKIIYLYSSKKEYARMLLLGVVDAFRGKYGKFNEQ